MRCNEEHGYIMILTIVMICALTFSIIAISNRTLFASALSWRRVHSVQAFSLAESASLEAFWQLQRQPEYRSTGEKHWDNRWYRYSILDQTSGTANDLTLIIIGEGFIDNQRREVRLHLSRNNVGEPFKIIQWEEAK